MKNSKNLNNMTAGGKTTRNKRRSKRQAKNGDILTGYVVSRPFTAALTPDNPGHASIRSTFEVKSALDYIVMSLDTVKGFPVWAPKVNNLLATFNYWRPTAIRVTYTVIGGAASTYYIVGNLTNDNSSHDLTELAVLDDDFAGVASSVQPLVLQPSPTYWKMGITNWYNTAFGSGLVSCAGAATYIGGGGALPTTVVGWCTVDLDVEFHTL